MKITLIENSSISLENLTFTFLFEGISNTLLQELNTSKIDNHTIYPLEDLKKEYAFSSQDSLRASKYIVMTKNNLDNEELIKTLEQLRVKLQSSDVQNIEEKSLFDSYKRSVKCELNSEKIQYLLNLKNTNSTSLENEKLSRALFKSIPKEQRTLFDTSSIKSEKK